MMDKDTLRPTPSAVRDKKRKPLKILVPAGVAVVVAVALLVAGIPGLTGNGLTAHAIALPEYPDLPQCPTEPTGNSEAAWEQFSEDYSAYWDAWRNYRNEAGRLSDTPELRAALEAYTGESTALALAGEGNRIYSPVSLWFALAMLAETTGGETRQQVLDTLGASDAEQLRDWADTLWHTIYRDDGTASSLLGTSIWLDEDVKFHQDTLDSLAEHYYTGPFQVPMGTDKADKAIGDWVSEQTKGLIGSEGKVLETDELTLAALASTLYYKAGWTDEFSPSRTEEDLFTAADGKETKVGEVHREGGKDKKEKKNEEWNCLSEFSGHKAFSILMLTLVRPRPCANSAFPFCGSRFSPLHTTLPGSLLTSDPLYGAQLPAHTRECKAIQNRWQNKTTAKLHISKTEWPG